MLFHTFTSNKHPTKKKEKKIKNFDLVDQLNICNVYKQPKKI